MEGRGVQCRAITKSYGHADLRTAVLHGIDADFAAGCLTLLMGPSGCGKTTLVSILAGLLSPDAGRVTVSGIQLDPNDRVALARLRREVVGFVFQQFNLLTSLTALENVTVPLIAQGVKRRLAVRTAADMLSRLDLSNQAELLPAQLS